MKTIEIDGKAYEEYDLVCPDCGAKMSLRQSKYGLFYGCSRYPDCLSAHGAHKATGQPLGIPADKRTKEARIRAHNAFDQLWMGGSINLKRTAAYAWIQDFMGMTEEQAHIGNFNIEQCERLIKHVQKKFELAGAVLLNKPPPKPEKKG